MLARKIDVDDYPPQWAQANLKPGDAVVIEATTNTWDLIRCHGTSGRQSGRCPSLCSQTDCQCPLLKTDKLDVYRLARLLAADLVPEVWVPPIQGNVNCVP